MGARRNIQFPHRSSNARDQKPGIGAIDGMDSQPGSPTVKSAKEEQDGEGVRLHAKSAAI